MTPPTVNYGAPLIRNNHIHHVRGSTGMEVSPEPEIPEGLDPVDLAVDLIGFART